MGTYTRMEIRLPLDPSAVEIIRVLEGIQNDAPPTPLPDHSFFRTQRWEWVCGTFGTAGHYDNNGIISFEENGAPWLDRKCSLKNYESDIERFLDWIAPAVALSERTTVGTFQIDDGFDDRPNSIVWDPAERWFLIDSRFLGSDSRNGGWYVCDIDIGDTVNGQATYMVTGP